MEEARDVREALLRLERLEHGIKHAGAAKADAGCNKATQDEGQRAQEILSVISPAMKRLRMDGLHSVANLATCSSENRVWLLLLLTRTTK